MPFDVSIITINYNSDKHTINCIQSLIKNTTSALLCQYIIVDNGSEKESYYNLKSFVNSLPPSISIRLIRSHINTGFGAGNMLGVQYAEGAYLAFINNDTLLNNDCLAILKDYMNKNPHCGVCGPQAFTIKGEILPTIDHFASPMREFFGRRFLELINTRKYPNRKKRYLNPQRADFIAGSFMFFNADDFYNIGGFDTNIFLYYEETDLCKRLLKNKKLSYLVPSASFVHYHGASTTKSIVIKTELKISLLYIIKKHYGFFAHKIVLIQLITKYTLSSLVKPRYFKLLKTLVLGAPLSKSLKHLQVIRKIKL